MINKELFHAKMAFSASECQSQGKIGIILAVYTFYSLSY